MRPRGLGRTADIASDLLVDDRLLDAVELVGPRALSGYLAVVLTSWARGERVTLQTAARRLPGVWELGDLAQLLEVLAQVGLLDVDGRIPETTWTSWYGPAKARADNLAEQSPKGVAARARNRAGDRTGNRRGNPHGNSLPPTVPPSAPSGAEGLSSSAAADPHGPPLRTTDDDHDDAGPNGHAGGLTPRWPPQTSVYNPDTNTWELHDR